MTEPLSLPQKFNGAAALAFLNDVKARPTGDLTLDAGAIESIGGMGLQALLVTAAECDSQGFRMTIENLTTEATDTLALLGVDADALCKGDVS